MSIVVHHLEFSRSLRILWLLEELDLDYSVESYARTAEFRAPAEFAKIHPLGRAPVIEVDGHVLAESGAILEYFVEREGKLRPSGGEALLQYRFFLHYAEGSAMPPLLVQFIADKLRTGPVPWFIRPIVAKVGARIESAFSGPAIALHFGFVEQTLASRPYFAGAEFSAADIQMFYAVEAALARGRGGWPHLSAWRERVTQRPAYRRAESKGGPAMSSGRSEGAPS